MEILVIEWLNSTAPRAACTSGSPWLPQCQENNRYIGRNPLHCRFDCVVSIRRRTSDIPHPPPSSFACRSSFKNAFGSRR